MILNAGLLPVFQEFMAFSGSHIWNDRIADFSFSAFFLTFFWTLGFFFSQQSQFLMNRLNTRSFPSGEWNGFYIEKHITRRGWMHLYLEFLDGIVKGEGTDYVGPWVISGSYDTDSGRCQWTKKYMGKHSVKYHGQLGEQGITGAWSIAGIAKTGPFHIWPQHMTHLNEMYLSEDLERENLASTSPSILLGGNTGSELPV